MTNIDTIREALERADRFCDTHTAEQCPDTLALPIKEALAALSAIDTEDNALKVGRYFCAQMPCSPTDCTEVPCRYMKGAIANRNNRESEAIRREARAEALKEAADRAMMWWYEGDKAMTEMNQINSFRAAILGPEPAREE